MNSGYWRHKDPDWYFIPENRVGDWDKLLSDQKEFKKEFGPYKVKKGKTPVHFRSIVFFPGN